nr:hypothetical protein [Promineifilum sp.]
NYDVIKWLPGSHALVFSASGPALYLYPTNSPAPAWALPYLEAEGPPEIVIAENGVELFHVYRLSAPPALPVAAESADFGGLIALESIASEPAAAGESLPVTLRWTVTAAPPVATAWSTFVHLEDMTGYRWSQIDQDGYPAEQWQPGEVILERLDVPAPPGMPPSENGLYRLRIGRFDPATDDRLPRLGPGGAFAGDSQLSDDVAILHAPPPDPLPEPPFPVDEPAAGGLRFLGHEPMPRNAETGETVALALWWAADAPLPFLQLRLSLVDEVGTAHEIGRTQPVYDTYPFAQWTTPAFVIDRQETRIPDELPSGDYRWRLELVQNDDTVVYSADLGPLTVTQTERLFALPPFAAPVGATFGEEIALAGYTLETEFLGRNSVSSSASLELIWQAIAQPQADYTIFVHVLNPDGTCCVWQSDAQPRGGAYPTSRWRPGEVVVDVYEITLPEGATIGDYEIEVGLYLAETGRRLGVTVDGEAAGDAVRLAPLPKE